MNLIIIGETIPGITGCPKKMSLYKKVIQHVKGHFFGTFGMSSSFSNGINAAQKQIKDFLDC